MAKGKLESALKDAAGRKQPGSLDEVAL